MLLYHIFALTEFHLLDYLHRRRELARPQSARHGRLERFCKVRRTIFTGVNTLFGGLLMHPRIAEVDFSTACGDRRRRRGFRRRRRRNGRRSPQRDILEGCRSVGDLADPHSQIRDGFRRRSGYRSPPPTSSCSMPLMRRYSASRGRDLRWVASGDESGYWQKPEANAAAFTAEGYFRTGDIGVLTKRVPCGSSIARRYDHRLRLQRLSVNEVEAAAAACAGIAECA